MAISAISIGYSTEFYFGAIVFGLVFLFYFTLWVLAPVVLFFVGIFERDTVRALVLMDDLTPAPIAPRMQQKINDAVRRGYIRLGLFKNAGKGFSGRRFCTLLMSPDETILMVVGHRMSPSRTTLMSRLDNGRWVITTDSGLLSDLTGHDVAQTLCDCTFAGQLLYHCQCIEMLGRHLMSFKSEEASELFVNWLLERARRQEEHGWLRAVPNRENTWVFRPRGALRIALDYARAIRNVQAVARLGRAKSKEAEMLEFQ